MCEINLYINNNNNNNNNNDDHDDNTPYCPNFSATILGMEFRISKCVVLIMNTGILEAVDVKHDNMKQSISKEYLGRIRNILK